METNNEAMALYFTPLTNRLILKEKMYFFCCHNTPALLPVRRWMISTDLS